MAASNFNSIPYFVMGTNRIATVHSRLARIFTRYYPVREIAMPIQIPPVQICMQWHEFMDHDPLHLWLRNLVSEVARRGAEAERPVQDTAASPARWSASAPPLH
jgi:hypothetical protein